MSTPLQWKPELWKPLEIKPIQSKPLASSEIAKQPHVFYGFQPVEETYEVRGILPSASGVGIIFKDQD